MTSLITKFVFQKILGENASNNQGRDDPYFETVPTSRLSASGQPKSKRQRKALPPGLTPEEERTLVKVKRRAYRLDMAFGECCGMKIGWSSLIAIVPAIGDVLDSERPPPPHSVKERKKERNERRRANVGLPINQCSSR